jgi:hypothetical protein
MEQLWGLRLSPGQEPNWAYNLQFPSHRTLLGMTRLPFYQRVASIAVGKWDGDKRGRHETDGTHKGRLTVLRGEKGFA